MSVVLVDKDKYAKEIIELSMYAFQYELNEEEYKKKILEMKQQKVLGVIDDDQLIAKTQIRDLSIQQGEKEIKMGGIQSVATYPEYRRNGYVKQLLLQALKEMRADNYIVSCLFPFSIDFYRKFGYEILSDIKKLNISQHDLQQLPMSNNGSIKRFNKNEFHEDLSKIYIEFSKKHSGMLIRTVDWWKTYNMRNVVPAIYYNVASEPQGYILYELKNNQMIVKEFIVLSNEARTSLWNFICQHDSMIESVEMTVTAYEPLTYLLRNPNPEISVHPYFMIRIVDVEKYLQQYNFTIVDESEVIIKVHDECAPWNDGYYKISQNGIEKCLEVGSDVINISINHLSSILFGYKTVRELCEIDAIIGSKSMIRALNKMIPQQQPYFSDSY